MNTMKVRLQYKVEVMVYQELDLDESEIKELSSSISPSDPLYSRLTDNVKVGMIEWWGDIENVSVYKV
jgi:hypothetical protein